MITRTIAVGAALWLAGAAAAHDLTVKNQLRKPVTFRSVGMRGGASWRVTIGPMQQQRAPIHPGGDRLFSIWDEAGNLLDYVAVRVDRSDTVRIRSDENGRAYLDVGGYGKLGGFGGYGKKANRVQPEK